MTFFSNVQESDFLEMRLYSLPLSLKPEDFYPSDLNIALELRIKVASPEARVPDV